MRIPVGKFEVAMGCHYEACAGPPGPQPKQYSRGPQVVSGQGLEKASHCEPMVGINLQGSRCNRYDIWDMIWYDTTVFGLPGYSSQCHMDVACVRTILGVRAPWIPRLARCVCCGVRTLVTIFIFIHARRVTTKALHIGAVTKQRCFRQDTMAY